MDGPAFQRQDCKLFRALRTTHRLPAPSPTATEGDGLCIMGWSTRSADCGTGRL